jgi:DNA-binding GntR family transcriptional regulator
MASLRKLPRLERSVLSDQVSRVITDGLLTGHFKSGDRLVESELAEMLGVSRSPIREAMAELQKCGLVSKEPGRGAVIRKWSVGDLEELIAVRSLLEGYAVTLVIERGAAGGLDPLDDIVTLMGEAVRNEDYAALVQRDVEFHEVLWEFSGNALLRSVLEGIKQQFRLFLTLNWKFHGGIEHVVGNHLRLMDAIKSGDVERAKEVMASHVTVQAMVDELRADAKRASADLNGGREAHTNAVDPEPVR